MDYVYGPGKNHLFVPGPVNIPEPVLRAMNRNNEDYRSPAIPAMTKNLLEDVKKIFKTSTGTPFLIPTTDHYRHPALLLVDGVSSICALDFRMDEWGVDVALTGSQKALSLPTGLGIVCASPKALEASKSAKSVRVFFDWNDYLKFYKLGTFWPYTPSIQLLYGLRAALDLIFEEGLDNVIARHTRMGKATRLAVEAWGLKNCTQKEEWYSDTVTAVLVPPYIDSAEIVKRAWKRYNMSLGLGLNKVAGKVFRIGHLGNLNELQLLGCLAGVEMILKDVGYPVKLGSGVAAACAYLQNNIPMIPSRI
uniref:Aminotransferase class V domain-containing protein n=1 Tax=Gossypium raimondii TaxID=29730 RepID=A0A0D2RT80_GOSRA|nr:hypothetical protein B456_009G074800 [Gossypium raimondii]